MPAEKGVWGSIRPAAAMAEVKLTDSQLNTIRAPIDRPLMILAAAGSGKTLVICHRILHLISKGVSPKDILAVTFTRRAGQDLLHRLQCIAAAQQCFSGEDSLDVVDIRVGTFHSFCLSVLRAFPNHAGLAPDFVVFTPKMQLDLLENLVEEWHTARRHEINGQSMQFQDKLARKSKQLQGRHQSTAEMKAFFKAGAYRLFQHLRTSQFVKSQEGAADVELNDSHGDGFSKWVFHQYHEQLLQANGIDFNSFVRYTLDMLKKWPNALESAGLKAQYIFVDEFQDTDVSQFELLRILCKDHAHITVVGDDDQQIYSWRGATGLYNIKNFENVFKGGITTKLEQNFRSTGAIVASARSLISKNQSRMPKTVRTASPTGTLMTICECRNDQCEVTAIVDFIISLKKQGVPLQEIAILYRLQRIGLEVQHNLQAQGIECHIKGSGSGSTGNQCLVANGRQVGIGLGDVFHDILAVLRLAICESDDLASKHLLDLFCPIDAWMLDHLLDLFCPSMSLVIKDCLSHLKLQKGLSLLQAIKSTRSHLVGLLVCDDLSSYAPAKSIAILSESDHLTLEGMHSILKLLAATKNDSKNMGLRDVIFNILQQISYVRGSRDVPQALKADLDGRKGYNQQLVSSSGKVDTNSLNSLQYAGIKALLKEAALFDAEIRTSSQNQNSCSIKESNSATPQTSYMDLKQHRSIKRGLNLLPDKPGFAGNIDFSLDAKSLDKLRVFLDRVTLKMHDSELGENNASKPILPVESVPSSSARDTGVTLSTIHQAKGLEWEGVILVRANDGIIPVGDSDFVVGPTTPNTPNIIDYGTIRNEDVITREAGSKNNLENNDISLLGPPIFETRGKFSSGPNREGIEEERRLMYVALTRAKRFVLVTHVMMEGGQQMTPSCFLADIPPGLVRRTTCYESKIPDPGLLLDSVTPSPISTKSVSSANDEAVKGKTKDPSGIFYSQNKDTNVKDDMQYSSKSLKSCTPNMKRKTTLQVNASELSLEMASTGSMSDCHLRKYSSKKTGNVVEISKSDECGSQSDDSEFEKPVRKGRKRKQKQVICSEGEE